MTVFAKDPASNADFSLDWTDILAKGESITAANWTVSPSETGGITLGAPMGQGLVRGINASGGVTGNLYRLVCQVTTDQGRVLSRGIALRVSQL